METRVFRSTCPASWCDFSASAASQEAANQALEDHWSDEHNDAPLVRYYGDR